MSSESIIIKDYKITNFLMNLDSLQNGSHELSFEVNLNIMTPKKVEKKDSIVSIKMSLSDEDDNTILQAELRGYVELIEGLKEDEKPEIIKKQAVPVFYENLRGFVEKTTKMANTKFPEIPPADDMLFE